MIRPFPILVSMYATTFLGEGLMVMYLFNNIRINGLLIPLSASFALVSYVPSMFLFLIVGRFHARPGLSTRLLLVGLGRLAACLALVFTGAYFDPLVVIAFIVVMEVFWYALMPCLDEIEQDSVRRIGPDRG